ncbi:substrate-binding domain-containing protein [Vibrio mediterranei]|uniref:substrate-binding domain-containing protein n=1 Tax=Vibrio mediterranei TaxID=689 RepID=UPI001835CBC4|nr:substrate-binding domain-containing protein [Vibrio mediterranei]NUW72154.1 substrate-binding domain-containing protein [Vibrio mediterranei]
MNIKDVAELAGVSPATISRYLNQPQSVAHATSKRIEKVITLTGYSVEQRHDQIEFNRNPTIGVVIPSLINPVFSEVVTGIQQRARHFGYSVVVVDTQYGSGQEQQAVIDLIRQRVEGVILTIADTSENEALKLLRDFKFPYCLLHNRSGEQEPCVFVDNYQAGIDVAQRVVELGHQRVGMLTGRFVSSDRAEQRYKGFKKGLNDNGLELTELLEVDQNKLDPFGDQEMSVIQREQAPTVWFCSNDLLALKAINAVKANGLHVPSDISIIGFDGMSLAQLITPTLATVAVPHLKMGQVAVDILFNAKAGASVSTQLALDYQLQMNGSLDVVPHLQNNE